MPLDDFAFDRDHKFAACLLGLGVRGGLRFLVEDHLDNTSAIANVEEEQVAKVAAAGNPAHDDGVAAFVGGAQRAAVVCALQIA